MSFHTVPLHSSHDKQAFSCGKDMLDSYLHRQAGQDVKRKLAACFVKVDSNFVQGYYTLSNNSIPLDFVPAGLQKKLPRSYTSIPTTLMGRLAVDKTCQKTGLGKMLLIDALKRSYQVSESLGSFAIVVDPLDDEAKAFYAKYGFVLLPDSDKMFLPMKTIAQLFA